MSGYDDSFAPAKPALRPLPADGPLFTVVCDANANADAPPADAVVAPMTRTARYVATLPPAARGDIASGSGGPHPAAFDDGTTDDAPGGGVPLTTIGDASGLTEADAVAAEQRRGGQRNKQPEYAIRIDAFVFASTRYVVVTEDDGAARGTRGTTDAAAKCLTGGDGDALPCLAAGQTPHGAAVTAVAVPRGDEPVATTVLVEIGAGGAPGAIGAGRATAGAGGGGGGFEPESPQLAFATSVAKTVLMRELRERRKKADGDAASPAVTAPHYPLTVACGIGLAPPAPSRSGIARPPATLLLDDVVFVADAAKRVLGLVTP